MTYDIYLTKLGWDTIATILVKGRSYEAKFKVTPEVKKYMPERIEIMKQAVINICKGKAWEVDKEAVFKIHE